MFLTLILGLGSTLVQLWLFVSYIKAPFYFSFGFSLLVLVCILMCIRCIIYLDKSSPLANFFACSRFQGQLGVEVKLPNSFWSKLIINFYFFKKKHFDQGENTLWWSTCCHEYYFWNYVFLNFYQVNVKNSTSRWGFPLKKK